MGLFSSLRKKNNSIPDKRLLKACGFTDLKTGSVEDSFVFMVVQCPLYIKDDYNYLSKNTCMLIDETIIAFKLAKYRFERYLLFQQIRDDQFMQRVAERVRTALSIYYNRPSTSIVEQWRNRYKLLNLIYISDESEQLPSFIDTSHFILRHDYLQKEYEEINDDTPVALLDFSKDIMLQVETKKFISSFDNVVQNFIDTIGIR